MLVLAFFLAAALAGCEESRGAPAATPAAAFSAPTAATVSDRAPASTAAATPTTSPSLAPAAPIVLSAQPDAIRTDFAEFVRANYSLAAAAAATARGLDREWLEPLIVTPDEAAAEVAAALARQDAEEVERRDRALQLLGVLAPGQGLDEVYLALVPDQVVGFYLSEDDRLFVVEPGRPSPTQRDQTLITMAHEYIHALQQTNFDIDALGEAIPLLEFDRQLALSALIEGDASVFGFTAVAQQVDLLALQNVQQSPPPDLGRPGDFVQELLLFPYVAGAEYVLGVLVGSGLEGLNGLYALGAIPQTTAEITPLGLRSEWLPSDAAEFDPPQLPCWEPLGTGSLGQFVLGTLLGGQIEQGARGPAGWVDDRLLLLGNGAADMLVYRTAFADPEAAATFFADLQTLIAQGGLDHAGRTGSIAQSDPGGIAWELGQRAALAELDGSSVTLVVGDHFLAATTALAALQGEVAATLVATDYCPAQ